MGKPFKLEQQPNPSGLVRLPDGRFARDPAPPADEAVARAARDGTPIRETVEEKPAVEYDEPKLYGSLPPDPDSPGRQFRLK